MNRVTKIRVHLCPLGYPGLINHLFSPGNEFRRIVLNLGNLDFEIVSDFDIRISDFVLRILPLLLRAGACPP